MFRCLPGSSLQQLLRSASTTGNLPCMVHFLRGWDVQSEKPNTGRFQALESKYWYRCDRCELDIYMIISPSYKSIGSESVVRKC